MSGREPIYSDELMKTSSTSTGSGGSSEPLNGDDYVKKAGDTYTGTLSFAIGAVLSLLAGSTFLISGNVDFSSVASWIMPSSGITGAGSGSGLDADKLDGMHSSEFLYSQQTTVFNPSGSGISLTMKGGTDPSLFVTDPDNNFIGIGNGAPTSKLDVNGTVKSTGLVVTGSAHITEDLEVEQQTQTGSIVVANNADVGGNVNVTGNISAAGFADIFGDLFIGGDETVINYEQLAGKVFKVKNELAESDLLVADASFDSIGVNKDNPTETLDVGGSGRFSRGVEVNTSNDPHNFLVHGDTDVSLFKVNGQQDKVSIGTTDTTEKLNVNGNIFFTLANSFLRGNNSLTLKETGDAHGDLSVHLKNRVGLNGVQVEQLGSFDLVEIALKSLSATKTVRLESRAPNTFAGSNEVQIGEIGNPAFVVSEDDSLFRSGNVGIGVTGSELDTSNAKLDVKQTSEQLRLRYDNSNYTSFTVGSGGSATVAPTGDFIFAPTGRDIFPNATYSLNIGGPTLKYLTLWAAELWVETLVAQNTIATIGGRILVGPTTTLTRDIAAIDTTIYVKHNQMVNGDIAYMESYDPTGTPIAKVEFFQITSAATPIDTTPPETEYSYTVTRNLDGSGANAWYAGDAMFNTGTTGKGFIDIYSLSGVKSGFGPTIVVNKRTSGVFNAWSERAAFGNLNANYDYATDVYGVAFGDETASWIGIDDTNGIRIMKGATKVAQWDISGNIQIGEVAAGKSNIYITAGKIQLRTNTTVKVELDTAGSILVGESGNANVFIDATGVKMRDGTDVKIAVNTDGTSVFEGVINLGVNGGIFQSDSGSWDDPNGPGNANTFKLYRSSGMGIMEFWSNGAKHTFTTALGHFWTSFGRVRFGSDMIDLYYTPSPNDTDYYYGVKFNSLSGGEGALEGRYRTQAVGFGDTIVRLRAASTTTAAGIARIIGDRGGLQAYLDIYSNGSGTTYGKLHANEFKIEKENNTQYFRVYEDGTQTEAILGHPATNSDFHFSGTNPTLYFGTSGVSNPGSETGWKIKLWGTEPGAGTGYGFGMDNNTLWAHSDLDWKIFTGGDELNARFTIDSAGDIGFGVAPSSVTSSADLNIQGTIKQDAWTNCTYLNSWTTFDASFPPCRYFRDKNGIVHLSGLVRSGTVGAAIFTLPAGYRPDFQLHLAGISNNAFARFHVETNGNVVCGSGGPCSNVWASLDGLTFRASGY